MKKIAGKIAMILVLVMVGGMFVSCFTALTLDLIETGNPFLVVVGGLLFLPALVLDFFTFPFQPGTYNRSVSFADSEALLTEEERAVVNEMRACLRLVLAGALPPRTAKPC
jgi:hypothetical protein